MSDLTLTPNGLPGAPLDEPIVAGVSPLKASTRRFAKNHLAVVSCFVLVLIVLFQPELRRALAHAGRSPLLRRVAGQASAAQHQLLEEVSRRLGSRPAGRVDGQHRRGPDRGEVALEPLRGARIRRGHGY